VDANGEPTIASYGQAPGQPAGPAGELSEFVMKLDGAASQVLSSVYLPTSLPEGGIEGAGVTGLATDSQNNLVVFGETATGSFQPTPGAYASPQPVLQCGIAGFEPYPDAFVMKLRAADWQPIYGAVLTAPCGIETGALVIDSTGSAVLAMTGGAGLPLRSPLLAGPACMGNSSALARLSADGSTLQFTTYLDNCGAPAVASVSGGSVYAAVSRRPKAAARRRFCV
jgi:hypothetical protein